MNHETRRLTMDEYGEVLTIRVWPLHQKIG